MALSSHLNSIRALLLVGLIAAFAVDATQVMHRPDRFKSSPHAYATGNPKAEVLHKRASGKVQAAYFTNWYVDSILSLLLH